MQQGVVNTFVSSAALLTLVSIAAPATAQQTASARKYFVDCPLTNSIRSSTPELSSRFESLGGCGAQVRHADPAPLPPDPSIARIQGVKEDPIARRERLKRERGVAEDNETSAVRQRTRAIQSQRAYDAQVAAAATTYKIDPLFLHAVIASESGHNPRAVSRVGARGLMQIMPATGAGLGVATSAALFDPAINIDAGARLLKKLQRRYGRNFDLILSAYNAGEGAVAKYGFKVPPYRETKDYIGKVMGRYVTYRGTSPVR